VFDQRGRWLSCNVVSGFWTLIGLTGCSLRRGLRADLGGDVAVPAVRLRGRAGDCREADASARPRGSARGEEDRGGDQSAVKVRETYRSIEMAGTLYICLYVRVAYLFATMLHSVA